MRKSIYPLLGSVVLLGAEVGDQGAGLKAAPPHDPAAVVVSPVNLEPGPEYADAARRFQGVPAIERASNGRLWAAWYGGGEDQGRHNYVMLASSPDDGASWTPLKMVIDPDRDGPLRAYDPCLWRDPRGRLWLFWAQEGEASYTWAIHTENADEENPTWSQPRFIAPGILMNKPTVLSSGEWLLPLTHALRDRSSELLSSTDHGATWQILGAAQIADPRDRDFDEPMVVELANRELWMLLRTIYGVGESRSRDRGRTWSDVSRTDLSPTVARFFLRRLRSGALLLVKHSPPDGAPVRSHLTAHLSDDEGRTWSQGLLIDSRISVSYPDAVESPEGVLALIYDYERKGAKQILFTTFTEADVRRGQRVSDHARERIVVNQAFGVLPDLSSE